MPIQYRCRCGQEVVLRPREGVYVIVGVLVALTMLNSLLLVFLWTRGAQNVHSELAKSETAAGPVEFGSASAQERTESSEGSTMSGDRPPVSNSASLSDGDIGKARPATLEQDSDSELAAAAALTPSPSIPSLQHDDADIDDVAADAKVAPVSVAFLRPAGLDGFAIASLLKRPPSDPIDLMLSSVAIAAWGTAEQRGSGLRRLRDYRGQFAELVPSIVDRIATDASGDSTITHGRFELTGDGKRLAELEEDWNERWPRLSKLSWLPDAQLRWVDRARRHWQGHADVLILIDLSESMSQETPAVAAALRVLVPLLSGGGTTRSTSEASGVARRWAWIAFRDEVVESFPFTDRADTFLASLERWQCKAGGDVPEGVDRALFEALRFEAFDWAPKGDRRLILIGDAPPPYERVAGARALLEAAHASPEHYSLDVLGVVREPEFGDVPSFGAFARAGGGHAWFVEPTAKDITGPIWRLLLGEARPDWASGPFH